MKKLLQIKVSKIYAFITIFVSLLCLGGYFSYAMFTVTKEKESALNVVVGGLNYTVTGTGVTNNQITVAGNSISTYVLTLTSQNRIDSRYQLFYQDNSNVDIYYLEDFSSFKQEFAYTGSIQTYTAPVTGDYQLEVWGASGGSAASCAGGKGGYSRVQVSLKENETLYIGVGGAGTGDNTHTSRTGGYNGGGNATVVDSDTNTRQASGGGATHIAKKDGTLSSLSSAVDSILVVAGGGGGAGNNDAVMCTAGGSGGGENGLDGGSYQESSTVYGTGKGGTQTAGGSYEAGSGVASAYRVSGSFGQGGNGVTAGGGGGFYGGGVAVTSAGGGSSYLGNNDGKTIAGNASMPTYDGLSTMTGNSGNGYAKITYLGSDQQIDAPSGTIGTTSSVKRVVLVVENHSSSAQNVSLGVQGGYVNNTIAIENGRTAITEKATFDVSSRSVTGGTITVSNRQVEVGDTVTFATSPTSGFQYYGATVRDSDGKTLMTLNSNNKSFIMPAEDVVISPKWKYNDLKVMALDDTQDTTWSSDYMDGAPISFVFESNRHYFGASIATTGNARRAYWTDKAYNLTHYETFEMRAYEYTINNDYSADNYHITMWAGVNASKGWVNGVANRTSSLAKGHMKYVTLRVNVTNLSGNYYLGFEILSNSHPFAANITHATLYGRVYE